MNIKNRLHREGLAVLSGILGAALLVFMSWQHNMPFAVLLVPFLLIYCFRNVKSVALTALIAVLSIAAKIAAMHGGWDISAGMEIGFGCLVSVPLFAALYLDRLLHREMSPLLSTLIFPAVFTALDFLLAFSPIGMTFSLVYTQSRQLLLIGGAALAGSWFVEFIIVWSGPLINTVLRGANEGKKIRTLFAVYGLALIGLFSIGSVKQTYMRPESETVRIASISAEHSENFWAVTDAGTPRAGSDEKKAVMAGMDDELFRLSGKAADYGAKIIFWSEGNYAIYDDQNEEFLKKAQAFAKGNGVYLMAAPLVLHYDSHKNDNLAILIGPDGKTVFRYEKTNSWYPTDSDGIIQKADTPYGRIGAAICFDMDFPAFIRQAADVDIMLVPAFDTKGISPYHSEAALLRGMEYGFSVVRQCNEGESIAADYNGNILAAQNYFTTKERCMISDVPTKGIKTPYELTGDWFAYLDILLAAGLIAFGFWGKKHPKQ